MPTNVGLDSRISFESVPEEVGTLVNDGCGTGIRFMLDDANVWKTSPIYWYGVLPDRECARYHHKYLIKMKVDGQNAFSRSCGVRFPEKNAFAVLGRPTTNGTHPGAPQRYDSSTSGFWYCNIVFEEFDKSNGIIVSDPNVSGQLFSWSGQYGDDILREEEFHLKQFRGEVSSSQGGQGDCYTVKGIKYFIAKQAVTNDYIATSTWIVKGNSAEEATMRCSQVIQRAVAEEIAISNEILEADSGFMELKAKEHVGYNAAFRYHCSYLQLYGASPANHVHPAYVGTNE